MIRNTVKESLLVVQKFVSGSSMIILGKCVKTYRMLSVVSYKHNSSHTCFDFYTQEVKQVFNVWILGCFDVKQTQCIVLGAWRYCQLCHWQT